MRKIHTRIRCWFMCVISILAGLLLHARFLTAFYQGRVELTDSVIAQDLRLEFEGVHFISNGTVYGFAEPSGYVYSIVRISLCFTYGWSGFVGWTSASCLPSFHLTYRTRLSILSNLSFSREYLGWRHSSTMGIPNRKHPLVSLDSCGGVSQLANHD